VFDYWFGYYPPVRYEPGLTLAVATAVLTVVAMATAWRLLPRLSDVRDNKPARESGQAR
jgi:hypothetical protein